MRPKTCGAQNKLHFRPKNLVLIYFLGALALALGLFLGIVFPVMIGDYSSLAVGLPILIFILFWVGLIWWSVRSSVRRQAATNAYLKGSCKGWANAWGIEYGGEEWLSRFPWKMLFHAKCSDDLILLYPAMNAFHMFPRRLFQSRADWETFRRWASSREVTPSSLAVRRKVRRRLILFVVVIVLLIVLVNLLDYWLIDSR